MKIVFLNLPNKSPVIRRYMCSYNAPNFLFPPLELLYLAAVARQWNQAQVRVLDAIAERLSLEQVAARLSEYAPELVVFLTGFEIFEEDIRAAEYLKKRLVKAKFSACGYFPTLFAEQVLANSNIDFCLMDEPELTFSELCAALSAGRQRLDDIQGLAFKDGAKIKVNPRRKRIEDLDALPYPARDLIDNRLYGEPLMPRPFTLVQTARGCPFSCTYCVKTFGSKLVCRSAENIVDEIEQCLKEYGIRHFRFIDDTFNLDSQRVQRICQLLLARGLKIEWTALSRADTLEPQTLSLMKQSGCRRLYIGIESGSQRILDLYRKGYQLAKLRPAIKMVHRCGIETVGFFMVGAPEETEQDFQASLVLAKELNFDYIVVFEVISYPGTALFEQSGQRLEFSLFPYVNRLKDSSLDEQYLAREKRFYREYYLRFGYLSGRLLKFLNSPGQSLRGLMQILEYSFLPLRRKMRSDLI